MKKALTCLQAVHAWEMSQLGTSLDGIKKIMEWKCSRVSIWRAIQKVAKADERIVAALHGGGYDALTVGEALLMLRGYLRPDNLPGNDGPPQEVTDAAPQK